MISNLKPNTVYAVHLRAASASGGKDWVGSITSQGEIHTYWGKTGQINQRAGKPGDSAVLHKIINQKIQGKDKYSLVDEYNPQQGWKSQRTQTPTPSPPDKSQPAAAPIVESVDWIDSPNAAIKWDF